MPSLCKWFYSLLVLTGILVSWEPGAETTGHAHAHAAGHELLPPHRLDASASPRSAETQMSAMADAGEKSSHKDTMAPRPLPQDYHYHTIFDFSSETCTDPQVDAIHLIRGMPFPCPSMVVIRPDSPFSEVEQPPLI